MKACPYCAEEIQDAAKVCKHCGRDLEGGASQVQIVEAPKKKTGCLSLGCAGLLALWAIGWLSGRVSDVAVGPAQPGAAVPAPPATLSVEQQLARDVKVNGRWARSGFGNVAEWEVSLHNTSKVTTWRDLQYRTEYAGESGKLLTTKRGEFNIVLKPGERRTIRDLNDGFIPQGAHRASIEIIGGVYDTLPGPAATTATPRPRSSAR